MRTDGTDWVVFCPTCRTISECIWRCDNCGKRLDDEDTVTRNNLTIEGP